jgi:hypothetical protein
MSKKTDKITTVSFNEGQERVRTMINETFSHMRGDIILDLQQLKDSDDLDELQSTTSMLQTFIHMQKSMLIDLDKCYCLAEIVNLSGEYDMFEECEEQLVGAFLGQTIIITQ